MTTINLFNDISNENITKKSKIIKINEDTHNDTNDDINSITIHNDDIISINSYSNSNGDSNNNKDNGKSNSEKENNLEKLSSEDTITLNIHTYHDTQSLIHLTINNTHMIELLIHLNPSNIKWFNSKIDYKYQIYTILEERILPTEFPNWFDEENEDKKIGKKTSYNGTKDNDNRKKRNKRRNVNPVKNSKPNKQKPKNPVKNDEIPMIYYGENIQLTYYVENISKGLLTSQAMLLYKDEGKSPGEYDRKFFEIPSLDKRIVVWCYPFDKKTLENDLLDDMKNERIFETIPFHDFFREKVVSI